MLVVDVFAARSRTGANHKERERTKMNEAEINEAKRKMFMDELFTEVEIAIGLARDIQKRVSGGKVEHRGPPISCPWSLAIGFRSCVAGATEPSPSERSAVIYTLLGSCRRQGVNPFDYLKDLFTRLPAAKIKELQQFTPRA